MNRRLCLGLVFCLLAFVSVGAAGVTVDYDREYDFTAPETFSWGKGTPAGELNEKRIVRAVEEQLDAAALEQVTDRRAKADLIVVTHVAAAKQTRSRARIGFGISKAVGGGAVSVGTSAPAGTKTVHIGTLTIDILDGATGDLVWQAKVSDSFSDNPEKIEAQIDKAVGKAFKKFPPAPKRK